MIRKPLPPPKRSTSRGGVVARIPGRLRKRSGPLAAIVARIPWRVSALRGVAISGLFASALLTADAVRGGRGFCPLAEACLRARHSALGQVVGVPTAFVGLGAFAALFGLTLLGSRFARAGLRPAALVAGAVGTALLAYQALWLMSFCPFCVVADTAGIAAGVLAITGWRRISAGALERRPVRAGWALVAVLAVAGPMLWPRPAEPAWIPVPVAAWRPVEPVPPPESAARELASAPVPPAAVTATPPPAAAEATVPIAQEPAVPERVEIRIAPETARAPEPGPVAVPVVAPAATDPVAAPVTAAPAPVAAAPVAVASASLPAAAPPSSTPAARPSSEPTAHAVPAAPPVRAAAPAPAPARARAAVREPVPVRPPAPVAQPAPAPAPAVSLVEYVNAFCPHCRATHARLDRVAGDVRVCRHRLYVWAGDEIPLWAQACVCAAAFGKEDALFEELLRTDDDGSDAVWAAASRVGIDARALWEAVVRGDATQRLEAYRRRADASEVHRLPTIDVGGRRLEGESSEADLRAAIDAAREAAGPRAAGS